MLSLLNRRASQQKTSSSTATMPESVDVQHQLLVSSIKTANLEGNSQDNQLDIVEKSAITTAPTLTSTLGVSANATILPVLSASPSNLSIASGTQDDDDQHNNASPTTTTAATTAAKALPFNVQQNNSSAGVHRSVSTSSMPLFVKKPIMIYKEATGFLETYANHDEVASKDMLNTLWNRRNRDNKQAKPRNSNDLELSDDTLSHNDGDDDTSNDGQDADDLVSSRPSFSSAPSLRGTRRHSLDSLTYTCSAAATAMEVSMTLADKRTTSGGTIKTIITTATSTETDIKTISTTDTDTVVVEVVKTEKKANIIARTLAPVLSIRASTWPAISEPHNRRNIAIGDLHGDLLNTKAVLKMAGLVDDKGRWIGGRDRMIQLGDVADRGPDTLALFRYLYQLRKEAAAAGGEVVLIMGNHELMTLMHKKHRLQLPFMRDPFSEHGEIGRWLKHLPIMQVIDGTVYAHGGVSPYWAKLGCERTNLQAQKSMKRYMHSGDLLAAKMHYPVFGDNGPAWYRRYAYDKDEAAVSELLDEALNSLGARRMVVAHSPTRSPKVHVRCNGKFIDIDTKISRFFKWPDGTPDGNHLSALEIIGDQVTAIYPDGREIISTGDSSN